MTSPSKDQPAPTQPAEPASSGGNHAAPERKDYPVQPERR
jgi:hypothetical protein